MSTLAIATPAIGTDLDLDNFFLGRLATLVARQIAAATPSERAALSQAAFAILLDCVDLGLGTEAQALMAQLRSEPFAAHRAVA